MFLTKYKELFFAKPSTNADVCHDCASIDGHVLVTHICDQQLLLLLQNKAWIQPQSSPQVLLGCNNRHPHTHTLSAENYGCHRWLKRQHMDRIIRASTHNWSHWFHNWLGVSGSERWEHLLKHYKPHSLHNVASVLQFSKYPSIKTKCPLSEWSRPVCVRLFFLRHAILFYCKAWREYYYIRGKFLSQWLVDPNNTRDGK